MQSRLELRNSLEADSLSLSVERARPGYIGNDGWKYQRALGHFWTRIGEGTAMAAQPVVNHSFEQQARLRGIPARVISSKSAIASLNDGAGACALRMRFQ